ncbi:MAG: hypothetical protein ACPGLY_07325 [Rubripirellula sp.]
MASILVVTWGARPVVRSNLLAAISVYGMRRLWDVAKFTTD